MIYDISEEEKIAFNMISRNGWKYEYFYLRGQPIQYIFLHTISDKHAFLFSRVPDYLINEPSENKLEYLGCRFLEWNREWIKNGNLLAMQKYLNYGYSKYPMLFNMTIEFKPNRDMIILEFTGDNKYVFFNDNIQEWLFEY
jgi:hypothetical protein